MKKKLYIIGAGSVGGHVALNIDQYTEDYQIVGFLDDDADKRKTELFGYKVLGTVKEAIELRNVGVVLGIAFPHIKKYILNSLSTNTTLIFPTLIHERAWVSKDVKIGKGSIIYPGTSINYGSDIGDFVVNNMNCALGHHTTIGGFSSLAPGVNTGGHTTIGEAVDIGIGASTLQNVHIGADSIIGGQSMVIRDVAPHTTVVGVPAKIIS